ncbi:MAG: glycoside hydrolase family 9 protein [Lachnospiraceae bacterium]|nr:glycoside hydrolase family 9 protein [Lachnospiraceae bacterium]
MKKRILCLGLSVLLLIMGSSSQAMATEVSYTYKVPVSTVKVLVDHNGYSVDADKYVYFLGVEHSESFRVIEKDTWKTVYTGEIEKERYDKESGYYVSVGEFSEVVEPGTYFIETDIIGRSYSFEIAEEPMQKTFQSLLGAMGSIDYEETPKGVIDACFNMQALFMALHQHGATFEKDNDLITQLLKVAEWMTAIQDADTGSIYEDYEATAAFCGIMAVCADRFGKYEDGLAAEYTTAYKKAWKCLASWNKAAGQETYPEAYFYVNTQLYRYHQNKTYQTAIHTYLKNRKDSITDDRFSFYGAVAYLETEKGTDRDLCSGLMQELVEEAEKISEASKADTFLVYAEDIALDLEKALIIGLVDYITPSKEYEVILENMIHYILGSNESGKCYLTSDGQWELTDKAESWTAEWNGILLFCLSNLLDKESNN